MLSHIVRKSLPNVKTSVKASICSHELLCSVRKYDELVRVSRCYSSISAEKHAFPISYLMKSFDFSQELATKTVSKGKLKFEIPDKPDSVLDLFEKYGFSKSQVCDIIKKCPQTLSCNADTLLPKFEFFSSVVGLSNDAIVRLVSFNPHILTRSLEERIIPYYNFLKTTVSSDDKVFLGLRLSQCTVFDTDLALPNIAVLREYGVPQWHINHLVIWHPQALMTSCEQFTESVEEVKQFGICPSVVTFVNAVHVKGSMSEEDWEEKLNIYRKWGWSDNHILLAFSTYPQCMLLSEEKITAMMDFFVVEMGFHSSALAKFPKLLNYSLKNWIIPRCLVLNTLISKGLYKKRISLSFFLTTSEKIFLQNYITCYENEASNLLKLYHQRLDPAMCKQEWNISGTSQVIIV